MHRIRTFLLVLGLALAPFAWGDDVPLEWVELPKAELHLHLGGAFPKDYLLSVATAEQQQELEAALETVAQGVDYHAAFRAFGYISQIINSEDRLEDAVCALCESLEKDHVSYVEIRTGLKDLGQGDEEYLRAVLRGIEKANTSTLKAYVILSLRRNSSLSTAQKTLDLALQYHDLGVIGIDLSGDSTLGQVEHILPALIYGKERGLAFTIHMGEAPGETDQMLLLHTLMPQRIGHGVYLSDEAKAWVLTHNTPIEVCLTSGVLVNMIPSYQEHPALELFRLGHPIVFCTDDPLLFSTTLSKELWLAHQFCGLSAKELQTLALRSFDYTLSSTPQPK